MTYRRTRRVVFQPEAYRGMQKGINRIANVIRPTLGPRPRVVAVAHPLGHRAPELLDDGATIARRIVQLPDRDEDVGAMFIRQILMQLHEQVGDGTATAAVLLQSIYNQGVQYIVAGGNAMRLRHYLEQGMQVILDELTHVTSYPQGQARLTQIAETICHDPAMGRLMGEIFDIIGEYGHLEIRSGQGRGLEREYVEGMYWENGILSREMIVDRTSLRTEMDDVAILMTDLKIEDPNQLVRVLSLAVQAEFRALLIVAQELSERAMALLLANVRAGKLYIAAVKTPGFGAAEQGEALLDMAMLVGGRPLLSSAGVTTLERMQLEDLGRAREAWADLHHFGIVAGRGDPRALRKHIADLRAALGREKDKEKRQQLQQRIGKLMGGTAILWTGGATQTEITVRKELAERTAGAMRAAIREGVLPGGGMALLACRPALQQALGQSQDPDQRAAFRILLRAVEEPMRTLVANAGHDPSAIMARLTLAGPGHGFDVNSERIVDMAEAGILDVAAAQKLAIQSAIGGAALALTTDVLVHHKVFMVSDPFYKG